MSAEQVHGTEWVLILSDWRRCNANVTVHLRGGVSLGPGKVGRLPGPALDAAELEGEHLASVALAWMQERLADEDVRGACEDAQMADWTKRGVVDLWDSDASVVLAVVAEVLGGSDD